MLAATCAIWMVKNRYVLISVALVEIASGAVILVSRRIWLNGLILLWLGINFFLYQSALFLSGAGASCPCLGKVASQLGLTPRVSELIARALAAYLLIVGACLLHVGRPRNPVVTSPLERSVKCEGDLPVSP